MAPLLPLLASHSCAANMQVRSLSRTIVCLTVSIVFFWLIRFLTWSELFLLLSCYQETSSSISKPCSLSSDQRTTSNWWVHTKTHTQFRSCQSTVKTSTVFFLLQAVRLESAHAQVTRYMVVVSTNGRQDTEESVVLGMDFSPVDRWDSNFYVPACFHTVHEVVRHRVHCFLPASSCSVGLVLPLWSDTLIHLDGDG